MTTIDDMELLFRSNYKAMLFLAGRLTHNGEVAKDIVHDVFVSLSGARRTSVTSAYLMNAVRFACLKYLRSLSIRSRLNGLYALEYPEIEDEEWPDEEDIAAIRGIVESKLSEQCRRVLRMRFASSMTYHEIAEELSISETAVYKHLRHAIIVLRQNFNKNERQR